MTCAQFGQYAIGLVPVLAYTFGLILLMNEKPERKSKWALTDSVFKKAMKTTSSSR